VCGYCAVSIDRGHYESAVNVLDVTGNNVTLSCTVTDRDNVNWLYIDFHTAHQFKVYGGGQVTNSYKRKIMPVTDCTTGNCSLILLDVHTGDSGWYVCVSERDLTVVSKHIVTLIVTSEYH
jgi:hypothetical protein